MRVSPGGGDLGLGRNPKRDPVQPGAQRVTHPERARLAHQHQKRGLKRILDVVRVAQHAPADSQHHRSMPLDQRRERRLGHFAMSRRELLEQLPVRQSADGPNIEKHAQVPRGHRRLSSCHLTDSSAALSIPVPAHVMPGGPASNTLFTKKTGKPLGNARPRCRTARTI